MIDPSTGLGYLDEGGEARYAATLRAGTRLGLTPWAVCLQKSLRNYLRSHNDPFKARIIVHNRTDTVGIQST
jgi:hypothetical protein